MFFFGSPEDQASLYWSAATSMPGPDVAEKPLDEMTIDELRTAIVYCRIAYMKAREDGVPSEALDILLNEYDEAFKALAKADDWFKGLILGTNPGIHHWLNGFTQENIKKYKDLASAS